MKKINYCKFTLMKKLLLLFVFIPLVLLSQENNDKDFQDLDLKIEPISGYGVKRTEGVFFEKDGIFKVIAVAGSGFTSINKMMKKTGIMMKRFALDNDYTYKYIKTDKERGGPGKYTTAISWYYVYDKDGYLIRKKGQKKVKVIYTKEQVDNAISELKKFKELLDLGIISQKEFEIKSMELKKIILN